MDLTTCTPENIGEMSIEEVAALANQVSEEEYRIPIKVKLPVLQYMYKCLGYQLSNDLLFALLADVKQQLILAPAGGCKTTSSQVKMILLKIF
ncbi:hypothetical protein AGMMS49975_20150 [Clostridia bacterium]|nr:hypothetical protein AGMMS49975_20150 [Clostridia bacterium]